MNSHLLIVRYRYTVTETGRVRFCNIGTLFWDTKVVSCKNTKQNKKTPQKPQLEKLKMVTSGEWEWGGWEQGQELLFVIRNLMEPFDSYNIQIWKAALAQRAVDMQVVPRQCFVLHLIRNKKRMKWGRESSHNLALTEIKQKSKFALDMRVK